MNTVKKIIVYLGGLLTITIGINISKMTVMGISPVSSIPRACEQIWGFTLGTTTFIAYILLVLGQLLVLRKEFRLWNVLGLALTVIFSLMVDITGTDPKAIGHLLIDFPRPEGYPMRFVYTIASCIIIGIGVFLYLRPNWVPMPAEGLALAISQKTGIVFGNCKSGVDTGMICIAMILQIIYLGGFESFLMPSVVVREGTVIAALGVGQVVKFLAKRWAKPIEAWLHAGEEPKAAA